MAPVQVGGKCCAEPDGDGVWKEVFFSVWVREMGSALVFCVVFSVWQVVEDVMQEAHKCPDHVAVETDCGSSELKQRWR